MFSDVSETRRRQAQMLLEECACDEMMEQFILMRRIKQYFAKRILKKIMNGIKFQMLMLWSKELKD